MDEKIKSLKEKYEEKLNKNNITQLEVDNILRKRMKLENELADLHKITTSLLSHYANLRHISLQEAYDEFNVPKDL
ncbi:unnamed protein product [Cunninghamella echinulata]